MTRLVRPGYCKRARWIAISSGWEIDQSQTHGGNPIMILAFVPIFSYVIYPAINRVFRLTRLRKLGIGFFPHGRCVFASRH